VPNKRPPTLPELESRIGAIHTRLRRRKLTVAAAESCTGGLLAAVLTAHGGSSDYFKGGAVVYSNEAKSILADVPADLIHGHGAVSSVVAGALARGARARLGAKIGLGITGIAGPGGATPGKKVGLTYVAVDSDAVSDSAEVASLVNEALAKLPASEARLLESFHYDRCKTAQLARQYGVSERAIEGRLRRARERLRRELEITLKSIRGLA